MKTVLTIAGSDSSGGAGIQADLKTITAHKAYGMSAVTALTAQNTVSVSEVLTVPAEFLESQLESVFSDIFPDAVKIGMLSQAALIETTANMLEKYRPAHVVLDPVLVSTSGRRLLEPQAVKLLKERLMPVTELVTPNIPEAELLTGKGIANEADMEEAARLLSEECRTAVLLKGGHLTAGADDVLWNRGNAYWYRCERISNPNTHGTGCTLSSAIACRLAEGYALQESVCLAKHYLTGAIRAGLKLGRGNGPLEHGWWLDFAEAATPACGTVKKTE